MNPDRQRRIEDLFKQASALREEEWAQFLDANASEDVMLAGEVLRMLRADAIPRSVESPTLAIGSESRAPADAWIGQTFGDFTLVERIGRGGMGVVYRARQLSLQRDVAVKMLPPGPPLTTRQIDRFQREARALARLSHPCIAQVLTVGSRDDVHYFAMEYVHGCDLAVVLRWLRHEARSDDPVPRGIDRSHQGKYLKTAARLIRDIADALHFAHLHGVVHRDVKPSNILLDAEGSVKLVDFGLARDESQGSITLSGEVAGTPYYMSPEQIQARRDLVDHRTDVYSLGVVLYELLTLRRPFEGNTSQEVMSKIVSGEPLRVRKLEPRVPLDLATICETAMARSPGDRYANAGLLRDDLNRFLAYTAIIARPPGVLRRCARLARRYRRSIATLTIALLVTIGALAWKDRSDRRLRIDTALGRISAIRRGASLTDLPPSRVIEIRQRLGQLHADFRGLSAEELTRLDEIDRELAALHAELVERGRAKLRAAHQKTLAPSDRQQQLLGAIQLLFGGSIVFPEDEDLRRLSSEQSAYPRVTVNAYDERGAPIEAQVWFRKVDPFTSGLGERIFLGDVPLKDEPMFPGYDRIIVVFAAGGFRELIRQPGADGMELNLKVVRRDDEAALTRGMARINDCRYRFDDYSGEPALQGKTVDLPAFWLDETEVSNRQYAGFLTASRRPQPRAWVTIDDVAEFVRDHGDLPVVGVSWSDAVAFAEWNGKRLPTAAEWHRASGGIEHRPFPYSNDSNEPLRGNVTAPRGSAFSEPGRLRAYLEHARPVDSNPEARSPEGIYHLYGNVDEWTESLRVDLNDPTSPMSYDFERFVFGGWWESAVLQWQTRQAAFRGIAPTEASWYTGFRCAKSVSP